VKETSAGTAPTLENTRTRPAVELSSSAAFLAFVSPGQPGRTAANSYEVASVPPVAGDDPVNASDPSGMLACPHGTKYTSQEDAKFTCLAVDRTLEGDTIWLRQGSSSTFGAAHAARHNLSEAALVAAIKTRLLFTGDVSDGGNHIYRTDYYTEPSGLLISVLVYVQFSATNGRYTSPDGHQIGITTGYCVDPRSGSQDCPSWVDPLLIHGPSILPGQDIGLITCQITGPSSLPPIQVDLAEESSS